MYISESWGRHQMETFSALLALCAGNSPVTAEFPAQRPVTRSFDVLFDLRLNKCFSKQSGGWWFETPSLPFWRHCNVKMNAFWFAECCCLGSKHLLMWWLRAEKVTSHCLNQRLHNSLTAYGVTRPQWINQFWYFSVVCPWKINFKITQIRRKFQNTVKHPWKRLR